VRSLGELAQTAGRHLAADLRPYSWLDSRWWEQLLPGSWRGVGFVMDAAETRAGRRVALHEYPYRDTVWPEDLGKLPRRFTFQAFLVGDDVYQQRNAMLAAAEQPGEGTLVHPTLGTMQCVLLDFSTTDRRERGRMVEISFQFVLAGDVMFPAAGIASGNLIGQFAGALNLASTSDMTSTLTSLRSVPSQAAAFMPSFGGLAADVVNDPTRALNSVAGLQGYNGRFAAGSRTTLLPSTASVGSAIAASITSRSSVLSAVGDLVSASGGL
jgi:prophage DNA circulation protein